MISATYCAEMARYNRWQNGSLFAAASALDPAERVRERGAFFGSIQRTLSHLLWGDTIWMSRFDSWDAPDVGLGESAGWVTDWSALSQRREVADQKIADWAARLDDAQLTGDLTWWSGALGQEVTKPLSLCIVHFFNHQTHHRGQVHAMLTAAGARPGDTDLFMMDSVA